MNYDVVSRKATLVNLSANPLYLEKELLARNVPREFEHGARLSMATTGPEGTMHFLKFKLWVLKLPKFEKPRPSNLSVSVTSQNCNLDIPSVRSKTLSNKTSLPETLNRPSGAQDRPPTILPLAAVPLATYTEDVPLQDADVVLDDGDVCLELCGKAVIGPSSERKIVWKHNVQMQTLIVGRRAQLVLHRSALSEKMQSFISRDHFTLRRSETEIQLTALATNPMYLKRGDGALVQIPKGAPVAIHHTEDIVLYTGEEPLSEMLFWHVTVGGASSKESTVLKKDTVAIVIFYVGLSFFFLLSNLNSFIFVDSLLL